MSGIDAGLVENLWRNPGVDRGLVDDCGTYRIDNVHCGLPVLVNQAGLMSMAKQIWGSKTPTTFTWKHFCALAREITGRYANLRIEKAFANPARVREEVAEAAQAYMQAVQYRNRAVAEAVAAGFRLEQVASWAGMTDAQAHEAVDPGFPRRKAAPQKTVLARPELGPVVELVRSTWNDTRAQAAPILAICSCLERCRCIPRVIATPQSLRHLANQHDVERDQCGMPTQAGFTALARRIFGLDLDLVAVQYPDTDPVAASKVEAWWTAQRPVSPETATQVVHISQSRKPSTGTLLAAPVMTPSAQAAAIRGSSEASFVRPRRPAPISAEPSRLVTSTVDKEARDPNSVDQARSTGVPVMSTWRCIVPAA